MKHAELNLRKCRFFLTREKKLHWHIVTHGILADDICIKFKLTDMNFISLNKEKTLFW